jgi:hypothetical protein
VAVDQAFFAPAGLDPIAFEIVKAFDEICIVVVKEAVSVFGGFDGHAITRQHVKMRGPWEGINGGLHGIDRCLNQ